ncbi:hypothetical protein [Methanolobus profundi]|uniref:Uncharacterized protein n=1 Tax=Methanolobus profundi TaxID=487685 RepID=A0A1I4PFH7_9EURY|nr:hypothetical protein [Methanolobus profundi]SFM26542.1 hypothetical protein SAMN04488696_0627 [Methanolobus profundi]
MENSTISIAETELSGTTKITTNDSDPVNAEDTKFTTFSVSSQEDTAANQEDQMPGFTGVQMIFPIMSVMCIYDLKNFHNSLLYAKFKK